MKRFLVIGALASVLVLTGCSTGGFNSQIAYEPDSGMVTSEGMKLNTDGSGGSDASGTLATDATPLGGQECVRICCR